MKTFFKYSTTVLLLAYATRLFAQQVPYPPANIPVTVVPVTPVQVPYPNLNNFTGVTKVNYVRSVVPDQPINVVPSGSYVYRQTTGYFDGLGRPLQTVAKRAHADGLDITSAHVYDAAGRERYQYLPFASPAPIVPLAGNLKTAVNTEMREFYDQLGPDEQPYSQTNYDNSALNQVNKQLNPGKSWVGNDKGVSMDRRGNYADEVVLWAMGTASTDIPQFTGYYAEGELYVTEVTDEDGNRIREYRDRKGNLILKKNFLIGLHVPVTSHSGYACTYYVYDQKNQLRYVIPPEAVNNIKDNSWNVSLVPELCYGYYYDERGRLVEKKIPGKGLEEYIYDKRDRLVMSRDAVLKAKNRCQFTFYDVLDRPIATGIGVASVSRQDLANYVMDNVSYTPADFLYYIKNYDLYHVYPPTNLAGCQFMTYTYYDDYTQLNGYSYDYSQFNNNLPSAAQPYLVQPPLSASVQTKGLVTGMKVRVLDPVVAENDRTWLTTVNYYDDKSRLIQSQSTNFRGGLDITSNIYFFQGMPWRTIFRHQNPAALAVPGAADGAIQQYTLVKTYSRNLGDGGGNDQVWKVDQKINDGPVFNLANYDYDHLGRVTVKDLRAGLVLQEYNVRGFLTRIDAEDHSVSPHRPIFEENLSYDKGFESKLYNGNIAGITWSGSDAAKNAYGYSYDKLNRLTHAEYRLWNGSAWQNDLKDYTASDITYDYNGNIQTMKQRGGDYKAGGAPQDMDNLTYIYTPNTNTLTEVRDNGAVIPAMPDFKDRFTSPYEIQYDGNGNMFKNRNKKMFTSYYNHLNKQEVIISDSGNIWNVYDALGNRLQKRISPAGGAIDTTDYMGNFVYYKGELQYILNEEGVHGR